MDPSLSSDDSLKPLASLRSSFISSLWELRDGCNPEDDHCGHHVQCRIQGECDAEFCRGDPSPRRPCSSSCLLQQATVNHRIHPTETVEDVLEHDRSSHCCVKMIFYPPREVIDDSRVKISKSENSFDPPPISPYGNDIMAFQVIANAALQVVASIPPLENIR